MFRAVGKRNFILLFIIGGVSCIYHQGYGNYTQPPEFVTEVIFDKPFSQTMDIVVM